MAPGDNLLAMDHTALKLLKRGGLMMVAPDPADRRSRRFSLADVGHSLLAHAEPIWRATHAEGEAAFADPGVALRADLTWLA